MINQMSLRELLQHGTRILSKTQSSTPSLDASLLLGFVLGLSREDMLLNRDKEIQVEQIKEFEELLSRRCTGEPVAYIMGKKSFWHYDFFVTPDVLIPKPDTELLVEKGIEAIDFRLTEDKGVSDSALCIADICTGSGCVAVSLLAHFSDNSEYKNKITLYATDISQKALVVANKNADAILNYQMRERCIFCQGDLLAVPQFEDDLLFDIIVSNPPYVPTEITQNLLLDGRNEPILALDGGVDGLDVIHRLIPQAYSKLKKGGVLLLETGEYNALQTKKIMEQIGFKNVCTFNDLTNQPRVTQGIKE